MCASGNTCCCVIATAVVITAIAVCWNVWAWLCYISVLLRLFVCAVYTNIIFRCTLQTNLWLCILQTLFPEEFWLFLKCKKFHICYLLIFLKLYLTKVVLCLHQSQKSLGRDMFNTRLYLLITLFNCLRTEDANCCCFAMVKQVWTVDSPVKHTHCVSTKPRCCSVCIIRLGIVLLKHPLLCWEKVLPWWQHL